MIVLDASALVSARFDSEAVPYRAVAKAFETDFVAVSDATITEIIGVLARPRLSRFIDPDLRDEVLSLLDRYGIFFAPKVAVKDCRDEKDNMYLELALASAARTIVSSDSDLLVLHPWRGVHIVRPAEYLAAVM